MLSRLKIQFVSWEMHMTRFQLELQVTRRDEAETVIYHCNLPTWQTWFRIHQLQTSRQQSRNSSGDHHSPARDFHRGRHGPIRTAQENTDTRKASLYTREAKKTRAQENLPATTETRRKEHPDNQDVDPTMIQE